MKIRLQALRRIIQEAISQDHKKKLWELLSADRESYVQGWELWDTLEPGGCPLPQDPDEWFGDNEEPYILEMFSETVFSLEDPVFFNDFCNAEWVDAEDQPKEHLVFEFGFPFVCGDEDAEYDFGMGESYFVVPGTDVDEIKAFIKANFESELGYHTNNQGFWGNPVDILIDTTDEDEIKELENGYGHIIVSYGEKL